MFIKEERKGKEKTGKIKRVGRYFGIGAKTQKTVYKNIPVKRNMKRNKRTGKNCSQK